MPILLLGVTHCLTRDYYFDLELQYLDSNWPRNLPIGVIHADIFPDNVFFIKNIVSGLIDFYFACNDFYAYELAICINAWCFENLVFNKDKFRSIMKGYEKKIELSDIEKKYLFEQGVLLRGAAMRFFLPRLHDHLFHSENAYVKPKDPMEYFEILQFHKMNNSYEY